MNNGNGGATKTAIRILTFFFALLAFFVAVAQLIPQVSSIPAKALTPEEFATMSSEQLVAKGKEVFGTNGIRCSQCHQIEGAPGRGPNVGGLGARADSRAKERAAAGAKMTAEEYILEAMIKPNNYVVKGFSSPSIMPEVYKPPMSLSEEDIKAAAAFLQSLGGQVTVNAKTQLRPEWHGEIASAKSSGGELISGDIGNGKRIFYDRMRCVACHKTTVDGKLVGGVLGPDLSRVGEVRGVQSLKDIVTNPPGDIMPKHFGANLTSQELNDLVVFLLSLRGS